MLIKDLFAKDLFRSINGVVKADQRDEAIVWQELDEYVVTKELDKLFQKFLSSYLKAIDNPNDPNVTERMGIWVSGFFGSGKSHFLKILSYLLNNKEAHDPASGQTRKAVQFFESKVNDPILLGDIKRATTSDTDVVLFNIDSKADASDGRGAILNVFWRVFNEMRGFCSDAPHVAEIERYLTEKGKYQDFCSNYKSLTGDNWIEERDAFHFNRDEVTQALAQALGQSQASAEEIFDKAEKNLSITVDIFAKRVKEYLDSKGKAHRIIFLVDEVGQFIGNDGHLMLNLQTITEDLGRVCQGKAWVVVTSQEDIDAVLGDLKASKANDFSKIQGRFNTRLPLSSSNTDEVIQARLLTKKAGVIAALEQLFLEKGDILKSQLSFSQDSASMKNYKDSRNFVENYPFAPYHFQLVQKIFEAIRKVGATGLHLSKGERSMLDAFQSAAKEISAKEIGALVPLYEFYPSIESFLDTSVKRTIDQASENDGLERPFDVLLLKTLFLVRYVDIIKPNVDNLVTLFIDKVDADRLTLKRTIEAGLQRLEKQTLVSKNGDLYYFLTNEEREVDQAIKAVEITGAEENRQLGEFTFDEILNEKSKHKYSQNKRDYAFSRLIDNHPYGSKIDQELSLEFITPLSSEYALFNDTKCVMYSSEHNGRLVIKLGDSPELGREVRLWLQVNKFVLSKSDASTSENAKRILSDRQEQNRGRRERIVGLLTNLILAAEFYALGQTLEVKGSSPRATIDSGLDYLVQNLYSKFSFLKTISDEPSKEIKATLFNNDIGQVELQKGLVQVNPEAVKEVSTFIKLKLDINHSVHVSDLVEQFVKRPYGWPEGEIVLLVARVFMAGEIKLLIDGDSLEPRDALEGLSKSVKWKNIKVIKRKQATKEDMEKASRLCKDLFGKIVPEVADDLSKALRAELGAWHKELSGYKQLADTGSYPGKKMIDSGLGSLSKLLQVKDTFELISTFNQSKDSLLDLSEDINILSDFYKNQKPTWEKLRSSLTGFRKNEAVLLKDSATAQILKRLEEIAAHESPYNMIQEVEPLVARLAEINETLLVEKKGTALKEVSSFIAQISKELSGIPEDGGTFSNKVLSPIQLLKTKIAGETSIPNISYHLSECQSALHEALELIEAKKRPQRPDAPQKQTKLIKASSLAPSNYLETEQDVDNYIKKLRAKLLDDLGENIRLRIQ